MKSFREIIVSEVRRRGWSGYRLGKESGVPIRTIQSFLAGRADLRMAHIETVCRTLGLELRRKDKMRR